MVRPHGLDLAVGLVMAAFFVPGLVLLAATGFESRLGWRLFLLASTVDLADRFLRRKKPARKSR